MNGFFTPSTVGYGQQPMTYGGQVYNGFAVPMAVQLAAPSKTREPAYHKSVWLPVEDELLRKAVAEFGTKDWKKVATKVPGRSHKQCRERYNGHLDPKLSKAEFTPEEDEIILKQQNLFGNRWARIATSLNGRCGNDVKNRWNLLNKRRMQASLSDTEQSFSEQHSPFSGSLSFSDDLGRNSYSEGPLRVPFPMTPPPQPVPVSPPPTEDSPMDEFPFEDNYEDSPWWDI